MNMRHQPATGYPKLLRIEPENENKQYYSTQGKQQNAFAQRLSSSASATQVHPSGLPAQPGNSHTYGKAASMSSGPQQQYGRGVGAVRYNYGDEQQRSVPHGAYPQGNNGQPEYSNTGGNTNFYLGGRTSSFGPAGCSAIQKQYSFGRYSTGTSTAKKGSH